MTSRSKRVVKRLESKKMYVLFPITYKRRQIINVDTSTALRAVGVFICFVHEVVHDSIR